LVKTLKKSWSKSIFYIDNSLYLCENKVPNILIFSLYPKHRVEATDQQTLPLLETQQ
jgi:hypothetical protein